MGHQLEQYVWMRLARTESSRCGLRAGAGGLLLLPPPHGERTSLTAAEGVREGVRGQRGGGLSSPAPIGLSWVQ